MSVKTDNTFLMDKVMLRVNNLPDTGGEACRVLDCFAGASAIWNTVQARTRTKIKRIAVDIADKSESFVFLATAEEAISSFDLTGFDVIDLDAYGCPAKELAKVLTSPFSGVIFVTWIQSVMGAMPRQMLTEIGFDDYQYDTCPILCSKGGLDKLKQWLAQYGVQSIRIRSSKKRKHYIAINRVRPVSPGHGDKETCSLDQPLPVLCIQPVGKDEGHA